MRKIFSFPILGSMMVSIAVTGCARDTKPDETRTSLLENLPFVYKMTVQQGNILTEEMVDALELGMTKRQVSLVLGTPPLVSFFHNNRWDYTYTLKHGHQPMEQRHLTLYFEGDQLVRIEGDLRPDPTRAAARKPEQILIEVPDYEAREGIVRKGLRTLGLEPKD
ncbi:outer membrane protein assembly factor BamE [Thermochromatium tepidum]|jgi:Small protein A (tmRNA-binding)|uniref:Outer membrane protein assembly factor BamE n=1 Tax=Thermochromatium tepidum ATCC 43061 TaxID=316276 RepID=A0A6I6E599_THETI|nr:outer membrane protein assembly factor BamE [Thermochromatium tepidum]QGU31618.1 outer membrane protein assembly factor BamE [Thermochromatium tepidum ATCC 43061]